MAFQLRHRKDIFLTFPLAFFDGRQGDVGGHTGGQCAHGVVPFFCTRKIIAGQPEDGEGLIDFDPIDRTVVPGEEQFSLLPWKREPYDQAEAAIDAAQACTPELLKLPLHSWSVS